MKTKTPLRSQSRPQPPSLDMIHEGFKELVDRMLGKPLTLHYDPRTDVYTYSEKVNKFQFIKLKYDDANKTAYLNTDIILHLFHNVFPEYLTQIGVNTTPAAMHTGWVEGRFLMNYWVPFFIEGLKEHLDLDEVREVKLLAELINP